MIDGGFGIPEQEVVLSAIGDTINSNSALLNGVVSAQVQPITDGIAANAGQLGRVKGAMTRGLNKAVAANTTLLAPVIDAMYQPLVSGTSANDAALSQLPAEYHRGAQVIGEPGPPTAPPPPSPDVSLPSCDPSGNMRRPIPGTDCAQGREPLPHFYFSITAPSPLRHQEMVAMSERARCFLLAWDDDTQDGQYWYDCRWNMIPTEPYGHVLASGQQPYRG